MQVIPNPFPTPFPKPFGDEVIIDSFGGKYIVVSPASLELDGAWNTFITVHGGIYSDLEIEGPADNNVITVYGGIGDDVYNDDGWYNDIVVTGKIGDELVIENSIGTKVSAGAANGGVYLEESTKLDIDVGWTPTFELADTNDSNVTIGRVKFDGWVGGDGNTVQLTDVSGAYVGVSGTGNDLLLGNTNGAKITVHEDAADTFVFTKLGDVEVVDEGVDTKLKLGAGNDQVDAGGSGTALYNGGAGWDELEDNSAGDIVADGFEFVRIDNLQGDVTLLSQPVNGQMQIGSSAVDITDLMAVFGEADEFGNAVMDYNGGSLTVVGAADDMLPESTFVQYDELLLA